MKTTLQTGSKLSVCLLALNEEKKIGQSLNSVKNLADEIIVCVDKNTTDTTAEIARKYTSHVHIVPHEKALEWQLERMFSFCTGDWILRLDADEVATPELKEEIRQILLNPQAQGYTIPRKNIIFGKWIQHSIWYPDYQLRLVKKENIKQTKGLKLHQPLPVKGNTENLNAHLLHYNYETVEQYLEKMMRYTTIEAASLYDQKQRANPTDFISKPLEDFIKHYLAFEGYKDGVHGLALSLLQAFYEFLVVVKLWELNKFQPEKTVNPREIEKEILSKFHDWKWWKHELDLRKASTVIQKGLIKTKRRLGI